MIPYIILNASTSLDGKTLRRDREVISSNRLNEQRVEELRGSVDAIMIGPKSEIINKDFHIHETMGKRTIVIIVDKNGDIASDSKILADEGRRILIVVSKNATRAKVEKLSYIHDKIEVIVLGKNDVDINELLLMLYERGIRRIVLEGDRETIRKMFENNFINEIYIAISPVIVGPGYDLLDKDIPKNVDLKLEGISEYGDHVVLHYKVK